jgi:hypothetical protein
MRQSSIYGGRIVHIREGVDDNLRDVVDITRKREHEVLWDSEAAACL